MSGVAVTRRLPLVFLMASFAVGFAVPFLGTRVLGPVPIPVAASGRSPGEPFALVARPSAAGTPADQPGGPPPTGSGLYGFAHGTGARAGWHGQLVRYQVAVEDGGGVEPHAFAAV